MTAPSIRPFTAGEVLPRPWSVTMTDRSVVEVEAINGGAAASRAERESGRVAASVRRIEALTYPKGGAR